MPILNDKLCLIIRLESFSCAELNVLAEVVHVSEPEVGGQGGAERDLAPGETVTAAQAAVAMK